jgi:hypothetical protein
MVPQRMTAMKYATTPQAKRRSAGDGRSLEPMDAVEAGMECNSDITHQCRTTGLFAYAYAASSRTT